MNQYNSSLVARPKMVSANGSARFTYLAEVIARAYEPTPTQLAELERAYNATGEYLVECPEFKDLLTQVHAHGSRRLGTIVRPTDVTREGHDIDLIAKLAAGAMTKYGGERGPTLLLDHLFKALKTYADRHGLGIKRWERCVTLHYAGGMRADFAPVIDHPLYGLQYGEHHGRIPDRELKTYASTNPKGYCLGFDDCARIRPVFSDYKSLTATLSGARKGDIEPLPDAEVVLARLLSRFVQLAKIHRNIAFAESTLRESAPTSVFLTSLIAKAYAMLAPKPHEGPLDLLLDIVEHMPTLFNRETSHDGNEHWVLLNPYAQGDNLAASMNTESRQQVFRQWHGKFKADLANVADAVEGAFGADVVHRTIEQTFGSRASRALFSHIALEREGNRALNRTSFLAAGAVPVVSSARAHTFYGDDEPR